VKKRIVITGIGVIAPNGIGKEQFWNALKEGRSGIKPISRFDTNGFKCKLGGEVSNFNPTLFLGSKGLKSLDRSARLLCSAAKLAIEDAKLTINYKNTDDIGVCTGTTFSSLWNFAEFIKETIKEGPLFTDASLFPGTVVNAASSQVSIRFNIQGFNTTVSTGYTSGLDALKYAIDFIKLGRIKAVLVGGVESLSLATFIGFYRLGFFAGIGGEELSCPFDKRRNGIILGSGLRLSDIDYISASANSVREQDRLETKAIKDVFGRLAYNIPVSSIKSMTGEPFSASGLLQIAASIGSIINKFIPPTINYKVKDNNCDLDYVANKSRIARINNVLINNFGPGGNNASLVISRYH
jgi:3-oxoacyl-[acyl-carrier-protein] synthase II